MLKTIEAISVGSFALRDPATGDFLPSVPLYIEANEQAQVNEAVLHREIAHIFAGKMRQYAEGCEMIGDKATADALRPDAEQPAEETAAPDKPRKKRGRPKK
ncbi:MAG: hypothetical protein HFF17_15530 [Oscillospiraceae bacterium]|nr:hypothetical protein [Oscillospiraceae bacterium]